MASILKHQSNASGSQGPATTGHAQQQQQQHIHNATAAAAASFNRQRSPVASQAASPSDRTRGETATTARTTGPMRGTFSGTRRPSQLGPRHLANASSPSTTSTKATGASAAYATPDGSVSPQRDNHHDDDHEEAMSTGEETDDLDMEGVQKRDLAIANQQRQAQAKTLQRDGDDDMADDATPTEAIQLDASMAGAGLAERWIPQLLSQHGPLAIRHLVQFLAHANQTFGALVANQQRRVVTQALESRQGVLFEKAGWGRWALREGRFEGSGLGVGSAAGTKAVGYFTPESLPMQMRGSSSSVGAGQGTGILSASLKRGQSGAGTGTGPVSSSYQSHHEFLFSPSLSIGAPREEDEDVDPLDLDEESGTDEEDWKALGPEALRRRAQQASRIGSLSQAVAAAGQRHPVPMPSSFSEKTLPLSPALASGSFASPRHGPMRPGSYSGSSPYPIRRKSSAGIYQLHHHHHHHHGHGHGSSSPAGSFRPPTFPKSSSFIRNTRISPDRLKDATATNHSAGLLSSSPQVERTKPEAIPGQDAEAAEALFMLSNSLDERGGRV